MAFVVLALLVVVVVRITVAPVSIPVTGMMARMAAEKLGGELAVGSIRLQLGVGRLTISATDIRLRSAKASANIDDMVLVQTFGGRTVAVRGGVFRIDPSGDGAPPSVPAPGDAIARFDEALTGAREALAGQGMRHVSITDGRVELVAPGRPIDEARVFQDVDATFDTRDGLHVRASAIGAEGPISVSLDHDETGEGREIDLAVDGLVPGDLAHVKPVQRGLVLALNMSATLTEGLPPQAHATIGISDGTVKMRIDPPRDFDGGRIELALSDDGRGIEVLPSRFTAGLSTLVIEGDIRAGEASADPWTFALTTPYTQLHSEDLGKTPVEFMSASMSGRIDIAGGMLLVDEFVGQVPDGRADAVFAIDIHEGKPWFSAAAHIGEASIDALLGTWPTIAAYQPRKAIADIVKGGFVRRGDVQIAFTPLEMDPDPTSYSDLEGTLSVDLDFIETTLTTPDLPFAIKHAGGALRMKDRVLSVRLDTGAIETDAGVLKVMEGALTIPDLAERPSEASISATVEGPVSAVVAMAKTMKLPQLEQTPLEPGDVTGTVRARLAMRTPLAEDVRMEERQWSIDATLSDAGSSVPVGGQTVSDADVEVLLNSRRIAARGKATIDGIRIDVNYTEVFEGTKSGAARFVLTDRDRRERGFDTGESLTGPIVVTVEAGDGDEKSFNVDLTQARIDVPGLHKRKGDALHAAGRFIGSGANVAVDELRMDGSGVSVEGKMSLAGGGLASAELSKVALGPGDDASVTVTRNGVGYTVDVQAANFDARKLLRQLLAADNGDEEPPKDKKAGVPVNAEINAARIRLSDETYATGVAVTARHTGQTLDRLSASGRIDGLAAGSFGARLAPEGNGGRSLQIDVTELGRMLAALGAYKQMRGGRTRATAQIAPDGAMVGSVVVENFSLNNDTTLAAIIERTQAKQRRGGPRSSPAALPLPEGNAMTFDTLKFDFDKRGDIVQIKDAVLRGQVIGGTADGVIDLADKTIRLNGTLIPAYGVNNMFGRVPVLGQILGAGDEGGLIGVTFRFAGPLDKPQFTLNPLSAVAPGIFRKIFEYR